MAHSTYFVIDIVALTLAAAVAAAFPRARLPHRAGTRRPVASLERSALSKTPTGQGTPRLMLCIQARSPE
jgi:hypothetical protein